MANGKRKTQKEFEEEINSINSNIEVVGKYINNKTNVECKCKICNGTLYISPINAISRKRISCSTCSDGISYPNKFVRNVLLKLPLENLEFEYKPQWASPYSYDNYFTYNGQEYIVETDGAQHYDDDKFWHETPFEIQERDKIKDELAFKHNVNMIRIDSRKSEFEYIKNKILSSLLSEIFNLSHIDWEYCHAQSLKSLVKITCDLYNQGKRVSDIESELKIHRSTVRKYLKSGHEIGWCNYINPLSRPLEVYKKDTMEELYKFNSLTECVDTLGSETNETFNRKMIASVCNGFKKSYKGFVFKYAS